MKILFYAIMKEKYNWMQTYEIPFAKKFPFFFFPHFYEAKSYLLWFKMKADRADATQRKCNAIFLPQFFFPLSFPFAGKDVQIWMEKLIYPFLVFLRRFMDKNLVKWKIWKVYFLFHLSWSMEFLPYLKKIVLGKLFQFQSCMSGWVISDA